MPELKVTLDSGETVSLTDCEWVFYEPCGCPRGCTYAVFGPDVLHDEDAAFRFFFDEGRKRETQARVNRERKAGVSAVLMTRRRWKAEVMPALLKADCPHAKEKEVDGA